MKNQAKLYIDEQENRHVSVTIEYEDGRIFHSLDREKDADFIKELYCRQINQYYADGYRFDEATIDVYLDEWEDRLNHGDIFAPLILFENGERIAMVNPGQGNLNFTSPQQITMDSEIAVIVKEEFRNQHKMSDLLIDLDIAGVFYHNAYENHREMYLENDGSYLPFSGLAYATVSPNLIASAKLLEKAGFHAAIDENGNREIFATEMGDITLDRYMYFRDFAE